jgi:nucleoside phosphorylase
MIAVTFALPAESSGLVARLRDMEVTRSGNSEIIRGKVDDHSVVILHTGVGRKSCEEKIDDFLETERPALLIGAGFAGSVRAELPVGDLILAENFSDPQLLREAQQILRNQNVRTARLFTSSAIVDSVDQRNEVARQKGADAVEMEAEYIAQACSRQGTRMLSLRVVSDSPHNPFPAPPNVLFDIQRQRTNPTRLLFYLFLHPSAIWRLIRFGQRVRGAREKLAKAIVDLVCGL